MIRAPAQLAFPTQCAYNFSLGVSSLNGSATLSPQTGEFASARYRSRLVSVVEAILASGCGSEVLEGGWIELGARDSDGSVDR